MIRQFKIERINENKFVAYFTVKGSQMYDVRIEIDGPMIKINPMACTCPFGSNYSQTKTNREQKKICRHLKSCIDLLIFLGYINNWEYEE